MIKKNSARLSKVRVQMDRVTPACVSEYIELERDGREHRVVRIQKNYRSNGSFYVSEHQYGVSSTSGRLCLFSNAFDSFSVYELNEYIENLVRSYETKGYEIVDQINRGQINPLDRTWSLSRLEPCLSSKFYSKNKGRSSEFLTQRIYGGIRVLLTIDCYDNMQLTDIKQCSSISDMQSLRDSVGRLISQVKATKNFRGAVLEGFYNGNSLHFTDVGFLLGHDVSSMAFSKRMAMLSQVLPIAETREQSGVIKPVNVADRDWLKISCEQFEQAMLVRHDESSFEDSEQPPCLLTKQPVISLTSSQKYDGAMVMLERDTLERYSMIEYPFSQGISADYEMTIKKSVRQMPVMF